MTASPHDPGDSGGLRVVVVNHNAGMLLRRCIDDLLAMEWPGRVEIVVVDNASSDNSLAALEADPRLSIIKLDTNTGFGANNEALHDLVSVRADDTSTDSSSRQPIEWVALVNPDAFVPTNFATDLVAAFTHGNTGSAGSAQRIGAVAPKIVFDDQHYSLAIDQHPTTSSARPDVRLTKVEIDGIDVFSRCHVTGDGSARIATSTGAEWHLGPSAGLLIPHAAELADPTPSTNPGSPPLTATLFFRSNEPTELTLRSNDRDASADSATVKASASPAEPATVVPLVGAPVQRIQNAGSWVDANGVGGNRGFFEVDDGRFDNADDVFAWCGAAVMLRVDYLAEVGVFDPDFFLYYEDTDLSWRGQLGGWRYRYEPAVVVRHRHSASTGQGSALTDIYQQRNRLRMLARNASAPVLVRGVAQSVGAAGKIGIRRVAALRAPGSKGDSTLFVRRVKGILAAAKDIPTLREDRRALAERHTVSRSEVEQQLGIHP